MKLSKKFLIVSLFFLIIIIIFLFLFFFNLYRLNGCKTAAESISFNQEYEVMRIQIYGSSEDSGITTLSGKISILDFRENEIASIERSWQKDGIEVVFRKARFLDKIFYFPLKVEGIHYLPDSNSWKADGSGTNLVPYYMENSSCLLFRNPGSEEFSENINTIASYALSPMAMFSYGACSDIKLPVTSCQNEKTYTVVCTSDGKIFLR